MHQIYRLVLPNIPDKLFRYRAMNDYSFDEFKNGRISLCHAGMFPDKYDSYLYVNHNKIRDDLQTALRDALRILIYPNIIPISEQRKPQKFVITENVAIPMSKSSIRYWKRSILYSLNRLKQLLNSGNRGFVAHETVLK